MWGKKKENISDNQVTNKMCEGKCSRCGECCGLFIPFNDDDIARIKRYVDLHKIKQYDRLDKETQSFKAHCCFYDEEKKECRIYPVRPYACKDFRCDRKDWKKYACIFGLIGQPFWLYTTYNSEQWGMFILSLFYTYAWWLGIKNNWLMLNGKY